MPAMSDEACIERFKSGESAAFGEIYDRYAEKIYRFVYYKTWSKETAQDIVSDVFTKALDRIDSYDARKGTFSAWLYRIARNNVIDRYRTRRETVDIDDVFDLGHDDRTVERLDAEATLLKVKEYLKDLSPKQREIVILRVWEELSYKEIAEIVGGTEGSVKMAFSRTIREVREKLGPLAAVMLLICLKP